MVTLHQTPRWRDVALEQIRIVGQGLRREMQVTAIVICILSILVTVAIARGDARTWFDSDEWAPIGAAAFLLPFAVWKREQRFGPGFLWTLPVDRRQLALAKVFGGWVWLMVALVVFFLSQIALAMVSGIPNAETMSLAVFGGSTALYLFGSAIVIGLRHPLRWIFGGTGLLVLTGYLNDDLSRRGGGIDRMLGSRAFVSALESSLPILYIVWLLAGFAVLRVAISRHGERRRH